MAVGFILITTETGAEFDVREAVSRIDGVVGQWIVFGPHDLFNLDLSADQSPSLDDP